jgi:ApaG protein
MYVKSTRDIRILVEPQYLDQHSKPAESKFVWSYRVVIENRSNETVQLMTRYWLITDSNGNKQEVQGDGVVGKRLPAYHTIGGNARPLHHGQPLWREFRG